MRGDLSETSVADLCRGLSDAEATGAVELEGPEGDARIFFRKGNVYWAVSPAPRARLGDRLVNSDLLTLEQLEQALEVQRSSEERTKLGALLVDQGLVTRDVIRVFVQEQILDALFDLMRYSTGGYTFRPGEAVDEKLPIDIPVDQLLVEVSRRQIEWNQIQAVIPHLDMVPDFVTGGSSANAALEPDEFAVLASVDGHRSVRDLAEDLGYSEFEAARIVYGLTLLGIVDVRDLDDDESEDDTPEVAASSESLPVEDEAGTATEPTDDAELEFDLDDLVADDAPAPQPDEDDIAAALEAALAGEAPTADPGADEPPTRPAVKVHVADDLSGYVPAHLVDDPAPTADEPDAGPDETPADRPAEEAPAASGPTVFERGPDTTPAPEPDEPAAADEPETLDQITAALTEALGVDDPSALDELVSLEDVGEADEDDLAALERLTGETAESAATDDATDEPEPWVADPEALGVDDEIATTPASPPVAADFGFFAEAPTEPTAADGAGAGEAPTPEPPTSEPAAPTTDAPAASTPSGAALEDEDFDALLNQLAGAPGGSTDDAPSRTYTSRPSEEAPRPAQEPEAPAPEQPVARPAASGRMGGSDVSEFLRELSRLALDEPESGSGHDEDSDDEGSAGAESAGRAAADSREADRKQAAEDRNSKKRGLFGWGR